MIRTLAIAALAIFLLPPNVRAVDFQQGIDVSNFQPNVNWASMKTAGIKFTFTKATEGVDFVDASFHNHMVGAIAAGMPIGPYHFARLNSGETIPTDAIDEANDFVDAIQQYYNTPAMVLRPVIDYEQIPNDPVSPSVKAYVSKWLRDFSGVVQQRLGVAPIIYTCCALNTSTYLEPDIAQYPLWIAKQNGTNTFDPSSPPTAANKGIWSDYTFWQWSGTGSVGGISPIDRDVFKGTMEELGQFIPSYHAGDFDRSGTVDAADYVLWRNTMGQSVNVGTSADGNLSGAIDADDYRIWSQNFGKTYASGSGSSLGSSGVPEPTAIGLALLGAISLGSQRATRRAALRSRA
jgi:GH25 family lysozyme M1 (1,4-beta-N-acetylmuramidase)